jgi:hypothetical protein
MSAKVYTLVIATIVGACGVPAGRILEFPEKIILGILVALEW